MEKLFKVMKIGWCNFDIKTKKDFMRDHIDYALGDREINLYCTYSGQLTLEYLDKDLAKLAIEETASTQDGSGF